MKLVEVSNYHVTLCLCAYTSCHVYYRVHTHFIEISLPLKNFTVSIEEEEPYLRARLYDALPLIYTPVPYLPLLFQGFQPPIFNANCLGVKPTTFEQLQPKLNQRNNTPGKWQRTTIEWLHRLKNQTDYTPEPRDHP